MSAYKDTINLPKTRFSMKANLAQRELQMLQHWREIDLYNKIRTYRAGAKKFILHDGPPYANGAIHLGHAVNKILKDIIIKSKGLDGFDAPYVPGWDCHGLPIELMVEKKIGKPGVKVDAGQFRSACRAYARKQVEKQCSDFQRLGVLGDWERPYLTMDFNTEANTLRALGVLIEHGHLAKGNKPVAWCIDCSSALAEAEVEYKEKSSPSIDVAFRIVDEDMFWQKIGVNSSDNKGEGILAITIWTTTPWTLPANQAVAVHPKFEYQLLQCSIGGKQFRLIVAKELVAALSTRYPIAEKHILACFTGQLLEHVLLQHPFYDRVVPITLAQHVTLESGTGAVHIAPGHGQDDYIIGQKYRLATANPVDNRGYFSSTTTLFAGQHIFAANEQIIKVLDENEALLHVGNIQHSYPHCWRHKTAIIFRATPQWFISMEKQGLRRRALATAATIRWTPEWGQKRITNMIQDRQDWCISRQRTWGVPIAVFTHKETDELHPNTGHLIERIAKRIEKEGVETWFNSDKEILLGDDAADYNKGVDILDVWFDSGVTHSTVLDSDERLAFPADLYLEGSDQYRGWFQSALLTAVGMSGQAPYENILTHGFTVDAHGMKMSKSKGNVIAPQKVTQTLGADVLRLWVMASDYRKEMSVSDEILMRIADSYRRVRNTARYLLANLDGFDPERHQVNQDTMLELDRWAVNTAAVVQSELINAYTHYRFHHIYQRLHHFCTISMGSFYLDIIKDRIYTMPTNSMPRRSAQTAMYHIVEAMVRWLAPILSFTAEEIWQFIPGPRAASVFLSEWYSKSILEDDNMSTRLAYWQVIIDIRDIISKELERLRAAGTIGASLEAAVTIYADDPYYTQLERLGDELRFVFVTSAAHVYRAEKRPAHVYETAINGVFIDIERSKYKKCVRCWHLRADIGEHEQHPTLCSRCVRNIDSDGEIRHFA